MKEYRRLIVVLSVFLLGACASNMPAPVVGRGDASEARSETSPAVPLYTIKRGDTLYSIALDHGISYRDLAAWNLIDDPSRIRVGQQLRLRPPGEVGAADTTAVTQAIGTGQAAVVEQRPLGGNVLAPASSSRLKSEPKAGKLPYSEEALALAQRPQGAPAGVEPKTEPATQAPATASAETTGPDDVPWIWPSSGKLVAQYSESGSKGIDLAGKAGDPVIAAGDGKVVYSGTGLRGYGKLLIVKHNAQFLSAYAHNRTLLVKEGQSVSRGQKIAEMGDTDSDQVKLHFEIRRQGKPVDPLKYLPPR